MTKITITQGKWRDVITKDRFFESCLAIARALYRDFDEVLTHPFISIYQSILLVLKITCCQPTAANDMLCFFLCAFV